MVTVSIDESKNLLTVGFAQHVGLEEARLYPQKIKPALERVRPGFHLLVDLSNLESMDFSCASYIDQVMDLCNQKGVAMVVRVIPDPHKDIGFNLMSYFHYSRDVHIISCENLGEANRIFGDTRG